MTLQMAGRRAEARQRLQQRAEAEGDDHHLDAQSSETMLNARRSTAKYPVASVML